ncbi:MAG TPA: DUF1587 domain-containing protein, partial [Isosphaeraceae bacterium]|nr:DUF1587 domain-containing protein [Isosphaeraceae bacterium]
MRTSPPLFLVLGLLFVPALAPASENAEAIDRTFQTTVRPFLETYCVSCHGAEKPKGDLNLSAFTTSESVAADLPRWALVQEQLDLEIMPPRKAEHHPSAEARSAVLAWIESARKLEATRRAGDPGRVLARRLSNAEYDNTIRDLTGVDLHPTREFPVDPANEAGFDNSAESLSMSPSLVKKYLDAARRISDHLVLTPEGLDFAPHPMLADTDRDRYCVHHIIDFYNRQRTDYADYFLAAWRFRHRDALGRPTVSLQDLAAEQSLSAKYLATLWATLTDQGERTGPIALIQSLWLALPGPNDPNAARAGCERLRNIVVDLRQQLVPEVENMTARGVSTGSQPFVLWKNRQFVKNRMRYAGGGSQVRSSLLSPSEQSALWPPEDDDAFRRYEQGFERFCRTFPDTFFVSERARVYLDPNQEKDNTGRLLSAGFHSMTGYFRDDAPLYELMLDDAGQKHLDQLWRDFQFITGAPMRQYSSYLWYERAESSFLRGPEFDSVRAEDKDAGSPAKIREVSQLYLAKARRIGVHDEALQAIEDQFRIISDQIQSVQNDRQTAQPLHIQALQDFAERAYRRPLTDQEREEISTFHRILREEDALDHEDAVRDSLVGILMSPHFLYRFDRPSDQPGIQPLSDYDLASRLS